MWLSKARILQQAAVAISLAALFSSCTKSAQDPAAPAESLASRGKKAYMANCVACHNANPALDGPIGPKVAGSSIALLTKRLMEASYPEGYTPKRTTRVMPATPHLKGELEALEAYLAAP